MRLHAQSVRMHSAQTLGLEQSERVHALQQGIKDAFDPSAILNPGKSF